MEIKYFLTIDFDQGQSKEDDDDFEGQAKGIQESFDGVACGQDARDNEHQDEDAGSDQSDLALWSQYQVFFSNEVRLEVFELADIHAENEFAQQQKAQDGEETVR